MEFVNNAIFSTPDARDWKYIDHIDTDVTIPQTLDLRNKLPSVHNQGSRGTCAANTAAVIKEYHERIEVGYDGQMSPEFVYFFRENKPGSGMSGRDVMKILQKQGIVPEYKYPYRNDEKAKDPTSDIMKIAENYRISNYAKINSMDELKKALVISGPCYISFEVYKERPQFWRKKPDEKPDGGHAVAVVGYTNDGFIIRNSWGGKWNGDGHVIYPFTDWGAHREIWSPVDAISVVIEEPKNEKCKCLIL
jgi:C1A family cysteine protease